MFKMWDLRRRAIAAATVTVLALVGIGAATPAMAAPSLGLSMTAVGDTVTSGDTTSYQVAWSCSSTVESCDLGTISVPVPTLTPYTEVKTAYVSGTASTGGYSAAPTMTGGVITWKMSDAIPAGSSGTMTFTLRVPNMSSPNGATVEPVATFSASGVTQTSTAAKTVVSKTDLVTMKRTVNTQKPGLDVPVNYEVLTAHKTAINVPNFVHGQPPANGTWAVENVVTVDHLPAGSEFVSASGGGVYDPIAHTVTWPAWSDNGGVTIAPTYQIAIRYPSSVFTVDSIVTNTASATAHPYLAPDQVVESSAEVSHGFQAGIAKGSVSKGGTIANPWGGTRGAQTNWRVILNNSGTVPLDVDVADTLPCLWSTPTDGSTACSTPSFTNVAVGLAGGVAGNPYTVEYTTNLGNTGEITLLRAPGSVVLPSQSQTEWVTSLRLTGTIPGGDSVWFIISGTIPKDLPSDSSVAVYRNPAVPKGSPVFLENCLTGTLSNSITDAVIQNIDGACGYMRITPDMPSVSPRKFMTDTVQGPGGQMGVQLQLATNPSNANWKPVMTDLLPADLRFVPGSFSTAALTPAAKALLPDSLLQVEVIDDYEGTGRQLVRVSWPGTEGLPPSALYGFVSFKVEVQPGAIAGQKPNDVLVLDEDFTTLACLGGSKVRTDGQNLFGDATPVRSGCADTATYSIVSTPAVGGTKWVRGSQDADYTAAPAIGAVLPGEDASYRLDVTNSGNVPLTNVVAYEILPHEGDTGVGPAAGDARGSEWQTLLTGAAKAEVDASIEYSTSTNPCRGEVVEIGAEQASGPADCVDDWTSAMPADPSDVRAIRIDFGDREFAPSEVQPVTIPVTTPDDASGIAWNSFAVAADDASNGAAVLPVEPNVVGLRTAQSLAIDKSVASPTVTRGGEVTWTIVVTNDGSGLADGVVVVDDIQGGMEYVSSTSDNGAYDSETETWTLASGIPAGKTATLTLVTKVLSDTPLEVVCNIATVTVGGSNESPARLAEDGSVSSPEVCVDVVVPPTTPPTTPTPSDPPVTPTPSVSTPPNGDAGTPLSDDVSLALTGPAMGFLLLLIAAGIGSIGLGVGGLALRRRRAEG